MSIPDWWEATLLTVGAFSVWRLLAIDVILKRPRDWLLGGFSPERGEAVDKFVLCPWCFGFWILLAEWGLWQLWPHAVLVAVVPFAMRAGVGMLGERQ